MAETMYDHESVIQSHELVVKFGDTFCPDDAVR